MIDLLHDKNFHWMTLTCRTLPSNLALCVNPDFDYMRARDPASGRVYIVAAARLPEIPGAVPKAKKAKKGAAAEPPTGGWQARPLDLQREECGLQSADAPKNVFSFAAMDQLADFRHVWVSLLRVAPGRSFTKLRSETCIACGQVLGSVKGSELAGRAYTPLFPYFAALQGTAGAFRVVADGYVTADSGTGVVHCAPAFGEDDMRVCIANGALCPTN